MKSDIKIFEQLKILENKLVKPELRNSAGELFELISDDFLEFGSSGVVYNKKNVIKFLLADTPSKKNLSNFKMSKLSNDCFLLTYKYLKKRNDIKNYSLRSSIWKLSNKKWQIVFHQGTLVQDKK